MSAQHALLEDLDFQVASTPATLGHSALSADERVLLVARQMRVLVGPHPDFDDLVQEALLELEVSHFRGDSKFSTFSNSVCYRVWVRHLRWRSRLKRKLVEFFGDDMPDIPTEHTPQIDYETKERYGRLYAALARLSPTKRAVLVLHDIEDCDVAEIAIIVGAKVATVRSRLRDGRVALAQILAQDPYFGEMACSK